MKADKETVLRLLKTASGQLAGIMKMIDEDRYCIDISNQLLATESILRKANTEILRAHMDSCVRDSFESRDPEQIDVKLDEIFHILEKLSR